MPIYSRGWLKVALPAVAGFFLVVTGWAVTEIKKNESYESGDILIQSVKEFAPLERAAVVFHHDRHTDVLEAHQKGCSTCHLTHENRLSLKFKRLEDKGRQFLMETYHTNCIGCHRELRGKQQTGGPLTCGECHREPVPEIDRDSMSFNHSLHYRHVKAADKECGLCHHVYDKEAEKTVYAKGEEGSCRYCHKQEDSDTGMSFRKAAHMSCLFCHMEKQAQNQTAGPVKCRGCHDPGEKQAIKTVKDVPRIERNQPDVGFVERYPKNPEMTASDYRMGLVPFDHRNHETQEDTCRVCHHESLDTCSRCHTVKGAKEGNWVTLAQAMHQEGEQKSCIGCHLRKTEKTSCAGCHGVKPARKTEDSDCLRCHLAAVGKDDLPSAVVADSGLAERMLNRAKKGAETPNWESPPETVKIDALEKTYGPVDLPHGKIISALKKGVAEDGLAQYFHNGDEQLCRGCHHNSPPSENPPRCGSCHGKPFTGKDPHTPGLMAAYHQQCMGCHREMNVSKPPSNDCTACHKEKGKEIVSAFR
ncbi:MAG: cytochrome c3 family protein [Desulfobacterales bacterium]